jgi:hypothetical protein
MSHASRSFQKLVFLLSCLALSGAEARGADNGSQLKLELMWHDAYQLLPRTFSTMSREVDRIFGEFGVEVSWKKADQEEVDLEAFADPLSLYVVLLPSRAEGLGLKKNVMGIATYREGQKGSVYVFFPEVVRALNCRSRLTEPEGPRMKSLIARALGRVIAHEVVHVLAPYHPHTTGGLLNQELPRRYLILPESGVHLDRESAQVVRAEIMERMRETRVASNSPAQREGESLLQRLLYVRPMN